MANPWTQTHPKGKDNLGWMSVQYATYDHLLPGKFTLMSMFCMEFKSIWMENNVYGIDGLNC